MKTLKLLIILIVAAIIGAAPQAFAQEQGQAQASQSLDQLLQEVRRSVNREQQINQQREAEFRQNRDQQQQLLAQSRQRLQQLEARGDALTAEFEANEARLTELETQLTERTGNLNELFGVVKQVAGDVAGQLEASVTSAQYSGRAEQLRELAQRKALPSAEQLRNLWYIMQQQITAQGKVVTFNAPVTNIDGVREPNRDVTRVGVFTVISNGKYLQYDPDNGLQELARQPAGRYVALAEDFADTPNDQVVPMTIDPTRGAILALVIESPSTQERVAQGEEVGYIILILGAIGLLIAIWRFLYLYVFAGRKVNSQLKSDTVREDNALGRILAVNEDNPNADVETLELKLDEAILRETPKLERGLATLKIIYVVAPLLGLLGTVIGMIETFQLITLFGTGDPRTMASGISKALVTTMLGLIVAIPLTFLHSILQSKARRLTEILEEQSAGIIALKAEKQDGLSG